MLVRYYVELAQPADAVEDALGREPRSWLPELVRASNRRGLGMVVRVGLNLHRRRVDHEVAVTVSSPRRLGDMSMTPISWRPTSDQLLLPSLEGDLEVRPLGDSASQLAISASYRPPLGWAGALADRAFMRSVAEATVKDFLDNVALGLVQILSASPPPAAAPRGIRAA